MHRMHGQFNFSQHASPYFPANHAQWSSHSTFADISMPKDYDPCSLWSKNFIEGTSVLYCAFRNANFLISRASDNVESRKRPNGTSPEYPTSSRSCRRLPHRLSLHPNRGPVLGLSLGSGHPRPFGVFSQRWVRLTSIVAIFIDFVRRRHYCWP